MATAPLRQSSFGGGEITPEAHGRTDHPAYHSALRRSVNVFTTPRAAAKNRPGTALVAEVKDSATPPIFIDFVFSSTQTYVLEVGHLYIRFHQNGAPVMAGAVPYEIVSPFTSAMLPYLEWGQAGDIVTICYGGQDGGAAAIAPQELRRLGHTNWTIVAVGYAVPFLDVSSPPGGWNGTAGAPKWASPAPLPDATHIASQWGWLVTQDLQDANGNGIESQPFQVGLFQGFNFATVYALGDVVVSGIKVWTSLQNGNVGNGPDISPAWWADGVVIAADKPFTIAWTPTVVVGYTRTGFRIYRGRPTGAGGIPLSLTSPVGLVGTAEAAATSFADNGVFPDLSQNPPQGTDPFLLAAGGHDYPSCVGFFEQRRVFGRQGLHPRRFQGSKPGQFSNFDTTIIGQDDDAISFDLDSAQFDEIRHFVHLGTLLAFTQSGVWKIRGFQGEALSPSSIDAKRDVKVGCSWVRPAVTPAGVIFVRERGSGISEATFDGQSGQWVANDLSVFAAHLFDGHTIVDIAFAAEPHSVLWAVRDDGLLLGCTRQGDVIAWHRHPTDGLVEQVCVVPEGTEDAVYLLVKRTINGATKRYIERMASRLVTDVRTCCFLDCSIMADGRNAGATTMKFTSDAATYLGGEEGTILASAGSFLADTDVGDQIVFDPNAVAGGPFRLTVLSVTDATHARAQLDRPLAAAFQNTESTSWGWARDSFSGLAHLEGKAITVLGDGAVQGPFTVAGGTIQDLKPVVIAQIGLSYTSIIDPLDIAQEKGKQKIVKAVAFELVESRGAWVGETESDADLREWSDERTVEDSFGNPPLFTGMARVRMSGGADVRGRAVLVQKDPLPMTVVGITREVEAGGAQ